MAKIRIEPWSIHRESPVDDFCESIFCIGNGSLGVRGFLGSAAKKEPQDHGIFRAGLFDFIKPGITDMVQLPDTLTLRVNGQEPSAVSQTLDMRRGVLIQAWENEHAALRLERAVSMADSQLVLQRLTITCRQAGEFTAQAIADTKVSNLPVHDDQMLPSTERKQLLEVQLLDGNSLRMQTVPSCHPVEIQWELRSSLPAQAVLKVDEDKAVHSFTLSLKAGETWMVEKHVRVLVKGETAHAREKDPWDAHRQAWHDLWEDCDIELAADEEIQGAVRYNIFQLLCNNASGDRTVSIGARGLTHGRYKGNTFWDTEIFLMPFYLWTRPEAALNLMLYRADRLPDAMELAKRQNLDGARYPWMCSNGGKEQCESWDIGLCETHITADVAYAMQQYVLVTGDEAFLKEHAAKVWHETAKYWLSRLTFEKEAERYSTFFVKGPDEYCGATVNNTYTNYLVRNNLNLALGHCKLCGDERKRLEHAKSRIAILYDAKRDLYLQDELLDRLEEAPFLKQGDTPSYRQVCFDRMQRYRVIKQADLVLLMTLFPKDFSSLQKRNIFEYYEPITLHDSTLSYGVHAQLALQLELWDKAEMYLHKGLFLDLCDVMGNTGQEGIHMAALGAAWQALVFGAAGLHLDENGDVAARPHLPRSIRSMRFKVRAHKKQYQVSVFDSGRAEVHEIS